MYLDRSVPACVAVVFIAGVTFFWLPTMLIFDVNAAVAGGMGGYLGGTTYRGAAAGAAGGFLLVLFFGAVYAALGAFSAGLVVVLGIKWIQTVCFGVVGGIAGGRP